MPMADESKRLNLVLTAKAAKQLDAIREAFNASTDSEAIRRSLNALGIFLDLKEKGYTFCYQGPDGRIVQVELF